MKRIAVLCLGVIVACAMGSPAAAQEAQAGESAIAPDRIQTFVYVADEIYPLYTRYGYQTNVEFSEGEEIETISLGDPVGFKLIPSGNRLFIKTLQDDRHTNMTVITNLRTYQFELNSKSEVPGVTYVARFYFTGTEAQTPDMSQGQPLGASGSLSRGLTPAGLPAPRPKNGNYSISGEGAFAPLEVYDDGTATYFRFAPGSNVPRIMEVMQDGREATLPQQQNNGTVIVSRLAQTFALRMGADVICVYRGR